MVTGFRGLILLAVVLGMPVASYFLVFRPQNIEITKARQEVEYTEQLLTKLRAEVARNADLEKAIKEIRASVQAAEARLPSDKEIADVVRQVSDLAVQSGLAPPALKASKPVQAALYMEQPLDMQVQGDFRGFFTFVAAMECLPRIMRITDMKVLRNEMRSDRDPSEKVDFTLSIYFQPGKAGGKGA